WKPAQSVRKRVVMRMPPATRRRSCQLRQAAGEAGSFAYGLLLLSVVQQKLPRVNQCPQRVEERRLARRQARLQRRLALLRRRPNVRNAYATLALLTRLAPTSMARLPGGASSPKSSVMPSAEFSTSTTTSAISGRRKLCE